jgi:hypothetical protein
VAVNGVNAIYGGAGLRGGGGFNPRTQGRGVKDLGGISKLRVGHERWRETAAQPAQLREEEEE